MIAGRSTVGVPTDRRQPVEDRPQRHRHLGPGHVDPEADVGPGGEAEVGLQRTLEDVLVGAVPAAGIAVRRAQHQLHHRSLGDAGAAEVDVARRVAPEDRVGDVPAHRLLDRVAQQLGIAADGRQRVRLRQEGVQRDPELAPRRARAGREQQPGEPEDLVVGQALAPAVRLLDLGVHDDGQQVVELARPGPARRRRAAGGGRRSPGTPPCAPRGRGRAGTACGTGPPGRRPPPRRGSRSWR